MIIAINYSNEVFANAQKFNTKMAKRYGADAAIEYSPTDVDENFKEKNSAIWNCKRGGGYWIWKPYIILKTLRLIQPNDYLVYTDSGSCFLNNINILINVMAKQKKDIMLFSTTSIEKCYSKRDAFILLDCDKAEYAETNQRLAGYIILKRSEFSLMFIAEWLEKVQDERIVTDNDNVMGKSNYEGFIENRHDQTCLSLLSKKWGIEAYRDPSNSLINGKNYPKDVMERSPYEQIIDSHRLRVVPKNYTPRKR